MISMKKGKGERQLMMDQLWKCGYNLGIGYGASDLTMRFDHRKTKT